MCLNHFNYALSGDIRHHSIEVMSQAINRINRRRKGSFILNLNFTQTKGKTLRFRYYINLGVKLFHTNMGKSSNNPLEFSINWN